VFDYDARLRMCGQGPAVVLVPGIDGTGRLFYAQVPRLAEQHTVATYALRDGAESMDVLVSDLARVVEHAAPANRRALVVGESFGGALALSFALAHPERVAGLVVLNSFPYFEPQFRLVLAIAVLGRAPWGAMAVVRRVTAFKMHSRHTHRAEVKRFLALSSDISRKGYVSRLRLLREYDVRSRLADIHVPTLFLAAELDRLVPSVEQARYMAERVPGARLRILEGHGHICLIAPDVDLAELIAPLERPPDDMRVQNAGGRM
jgi:pimeloyl-ACP methyl ester carboxylesterase